MEEYLTDRKRRRGQPDLVAVDDALYPTLGPENRYRTLLCIEKEGFFGLIQEARIMERFDCGLISSKGVWGTAARWGIENLALDGVRILVLHDFDRSGACIAHTINHNTQRYQFKNPPEVIDLGLSLADAKEMGLQDEAAEDEGPGEDRLREYGRSEDEISCLMQGRRVELNAMNADQFIGYVEEALTEHGAGKVVPRDGVLERHARRLLARRVVRDELPPLIAAAEARVATVALSADLRERVHDRQEEEPELPWEDALEAELEDVTPDEGQSAC
jgi:hypothetical protein